MRQFLRQIIQWAELHYPSWVAIGGSVPLYRDDPGAADVADVRVQQQPRTPVKMVANGAAGAPAAAQAAAAPDRADMKLLMIVMGGVVSLIVVSFAVVVLLVYYLNSVSSDLPQHRWSLMSISVTEARSQHFRDLQDGPASGIETIGVLRCMSICNTSVCMRSPFPRQIRTLRIQVCPRGDLRAQLDCDVFGLAQDSQEVLCGRLWSTLR